MTYGHTAPMIYVYSSHPNPRKLYAFGAVLKDLMHLKYTVIDNVKSCPAGQPLIVYGENNIENSFCIPSCGLLDEKGINPKSVKFTLRENQFLLFANEDSTFDLNFDIFSAAFYLLSRYEEYVCKERDEHGRFQAKNSILHQHGLIKEPILDRYTTELYNRLIIKWPDYIFEQRKFRYELTFDIDMAWSFLHKGLMRNVGGLLKDLFRLHFKDVKSRIQVLSGRKTDPYFCFDSINELPMNESGEKLMFFLAAGKRSKYDKNALRNAPAFKKLIQEQMGKFMIGLHPSYQSSLEPSLIHEEQQFLSKLANEPITRSRQHYLKLNIPHTYQQLAAAGVLHDYSMGYAETTGFRAGTSLPFHFYDLHNETEMPFQVHPFCIMDGTLKDYLKLDITESKNEILSMLDTLRSVNGKFSILLHNETLSGINRWSGWNEMISELADRLKEITK